MKASLRKAHPEWPEEEVEKKAAMTFGSVFGTNPQHAEKLESEGKWEGYKHSHSKKDKKEINRYFSFVPGFEIKERDGTKYAEGFVSDSAEDIGHDILGDQKNLVDKLNSGNAVVSKLSWRHDWMKAKENTSEREITPFGVMAQKAELRSNPISGNMAAWASYKLNPHYPDFDKKVEQAKEGFVNAFSIEYDVLPGGATYETIGNVRRRYIKEYNILGVGVAARPMQPNAIMTGFYAKEYEMAEEQQGKIGKHNSVPDEEFDADELCGGATHEMEHTDNVEDAKSIAKDHLSEDPDYYKKLRKMEERKESDAENFGSAAARQETAKRQGGNTMEDKERAELLQKQLDEANAQKKELEGKVKELSGQTTALGELKEDYAKFKKEQEAKVLANAQAKEVEEKEHQAKEAQVKEFKELFASYKEKPTWEAANELIRRVGGPLEAG
jgi:hypothetical protein